MSTSPLRPRVNYSQELRDNINQMLATLTDMKASQIKLETNQQRLEAAQMATSISMAKIEASMPTRSELASQYVSITAFQGLASTVGDIKKKQDEQPQNWWGKLAVIIAGISAAVAVLGALHVI